MNIYYRRILIFLCYIAAASSTLAHNSGNPHHKTARYYVESMHASMNWIEGYVKTIAGQDIDYHSANPNAKAALISRATDGKTSIEWQTATAKDKNSDFVTFAWLAGIGCNTGEQPFDLEVNGKKIFTFRTKYNKKWHIKGKDGSELSFNGTKRDVHGDLFGYMILKVPAQKVGGPASIRITGHDKQSNAWVMTYCYPYAVQNFRKSAFNGFWYKFTHLKTGEMEIDFPASWAGKKIVIKDQENLIAEQVLKVKNDKCRINFSAGKKVKYPILLTVDGKPIDKIPSLIGHGDDYKGNEGSPVIYRTWESNNQKYQLETSKSNFILVPEDRLPWPENTQEFPAGAMDKDNKIWVAMIERFEQENHLAVYQVENNQWKNVCSLDPKNRTGIAAPAIASYENGCVVAFPIESEDKWSIAYTFIDSDESRNPEIMYIKSEGNSNISPDLAVAGKDVYVVWESNNGEARGIYSCALTKKGHNKIIRISSPVYNSYNPAIISMENGSLFAVWDSYRNNSADIWGAEFKNEKWRKEFRITSDPRIERHPSLAVNGSELWLAWQAQSYGNKELEHNQTKLIELNHVDEQRIVVAQIDNVGLRSPVDLFNKISTKDEMLLRPYIAFTPAGALILTVRESLNRNDGWRPVMWKYDNNGWSEKEILKDFRGRWQPIPVVCSSNSIFTFAQFDNQPSGGSVIAKDVDWHSAIELKTMEIQNQDNSISLQTELLEMPPSDFSLAERCELVAADFPRQKTNFNGKELKLFFGDFHEHTDISSCARENNPPGHDLFANLRDIEKIDFCALTDHHSNIDRTIWQFNGEQTRNNHDPGQFVTFLGQEWSSSAGPKSFGYGHHNFVFLDPYVKSYISESKSYLNPIQLWETMKSIEFISIPHQLADWEDLFRAKGNWGNPPKDWNYYDEKLQPVAEIFQVRGSYEYFGCPRQSESAAPFSRFYLQGAWKRGISSVLSPALTMAADTVRSASGRKI